MPIRWVKIEKLRLKDQEGNKPPTRSEIILLSRVQLILPISEMAHGPEGCKEMRVWFLFLCVWSPPPTHPGPSNPLSHTLLNRPHCIREDNGCSFSIPLFSEGNMTNLHISWSLLRDSMVALTFHIFPFIIHDYYLSKVTKILFFVSFSLILNPRRTGTLVSLPFIKPWSCSAFQKEKCRKNLKSVKCQPEWNFVKLNLVKYYVQNIGSLTNVQPRNDCIVWNTMGLL